MPDIYNIEEVKDQFIANTIEEYTQRYAPQMIDLAVYYLNDFVNNLVANDLVLLKLEAQPEPEPEPIPVQQQVQRPIYQPPQTQRTQSPVQQAPPRMAATPYQPQPQPSMYSQNPFQEQEAQVVEEYRDPRTQRMRVDDTRVRQEVAEMNEQLRVPVPPRNFRAQAPVHEEQHRQDVNLVSEKNKTFVDKIKEMRNPRKKEGINPDE